MVIKSDEFNGSTINPIWTTVNPKNDATFSVSNGVLSISVPAGSEHDLWGVNNTARIVQPHDNTDFEIEAKFNSIPSTQHQIQGILVEQDASNYLRFDFVSSGTNIRVFSAKIRNGIPIMIRDLYIPSLQTNLYMKCNRTGNTWTVNYSTDGITWINLSTFTEIITASKVGVYGGNGLGISSPQYTAKIEYFRNTQIPLLTPIAHWAFEEQSGSAILDSSGNGFDGTIFGGLTRSQGISGNALLTDGMNLSYGNVKTSTLTKTLPTGLSPRSISAWVFMSEYTPESFVFFYGSPSSKNAFYIKTSWDSVLGGAYDLTLGDITSPGFFALNQWYHICLTYDGITAILYGNGVKLVDMVVPDWSLTERVDGGYINIDWQGNSPAKMKIDEIKVFDKALTPTEVLQESGSITPPPTCSPVNATLSLL